jgi:hypothetical protein
MIVTLMFGARGSWLYVWAFDVGRCRGSEVGLDHLDVLIAVEFAHVDCRFPELPGVIDRRGATRSDARWRRSKRRGGGCVTRCAGGEVGTSTRWRSRRTASHSSWRRRRGRMAIDISLEFATRRHGRRAGVGAGVDAARCR